MEPFPATSDSTGSAASEPASPADQDNGRAAEDQSLGVGEGEQNAEGQPEDSQVEEKEGESKGGTKDLNEDQRHSAHLVELGEQAKGALLGGEEVAAWLVDPVSTGTSFIPEAVRPAPGAAKKGGAGGSPAKSRPGAAAEKGQEKPRWGIGSKKALEDRMARRSFPDTVHAVLASQETASPKKSRGARKLSKARDVSPVIDRGDQKELIRQRLVERQKQDKQRVEQLVAAKTAFLHSIKETLKNEAASRQLSAFLEKKRAQRERCFLKKSPVGPSAGASLRKGLPSLAAIVVSASPTSSPTSPALSAASPSTASMGSASSSPRRPPWNASPKVLPLDSTAPDGSPLTGTGRMPPLATVATQHHSPKESKSSTMPVTLGGPQPAGWRSAAKIHDHDPEMQVLRAVRRREELLGRLRTLLLAKAGTDGVPHQSSVAACLDALRVASLDAVEAVQAWRVHQGHHQRPFVWAGTDYLLKMNTDLGNLVASEPVVQIWLGFDIWLDPFCTGLVAPAAAAPISGPRYQPALDASQALRVRTALAVLADSAGSTAQLTKQRMELLGSPSRGSRNLSNKQPLLLSPAIALHDPPKPLKEDALNSRQDTDPGQCEQQIGPFEDGGSTHEESTRGMTTNDLIFEREDPAKDATRKALQSPIDETSSHLLENNGGEAHMLDLSTSIPTPFSALEIVPTSLSMSRRGSKEGGSQINDTASMDSLDTHKLHYDSKIIQHATLKGVALDTGITSALEDLVTDVVKSTYMKDQTDS